MNRKITSFLLVLMLFGTSLQATEFSEVVVEGMNDLKSSSSDSSLVGATEEGKEPFKPNINLGALVHMFFGREQVGYGPGGSPAAENANSWKNELSILRARVLVGGQLSEKGSFFLQTELPFPTILGPRKDSLSKSIRVAPMMLDIQYEHRFSNAFSVIVGKSLVSHNRNGLQSAASLMANDFTYYQYPYNMFDDSPLQGNLGRDIGINTRGFFAKDKLEYRLGVFSGRRFTDNSPFRVVGRVVYNFLEPEKDFYYNGTSLGKAKTIALGGGFDTQSTYVNIGADLFVDMPLGDAGSITLNSAYTYMTGGDNPEEKYSFASMIPTQNIQFLELGYYFTDWKLQPWIRYENQNMNAEAGQTNMDLELFDKLNSKKVFGGGLNYFFNGYNTNVRLSYTTFTHEIPQGTETKSKTFGQVWAQLQFFIF